MQTEKVVKFQYTPAQELLSLFDNFRQTCNDAIRIAIAHDAFSRFDLISKSYDYLNDYGLNPHYFQNACEVAFPICNGWREVAPEKLRQISTLSYFRRRGVLGELARRRILYPPSRDHS